MAGKSYAVVEKNGKGSWSYPETGTTIRTYHGDPDESKGVSSSRYEDSDKLKKGIKTHERYNDPQIEFGKDEKTVKKRNILKARRGEVPQVKSQYNQKFTKEDLADPSSYKKGGKVKKTGMALVHKGERVLTKKQAAKPAVKKAIKRK